MLEMSLVAAAAMVVAAWAACSPASPRTRSRDRARWVRRNPHRVTSEDVHAELAHQLGAAHADVVCERGRELGLTPLVMWLWMQRFDARFLALAVAADLLQDELLRHLAHGTAPDQGDLEVLAGLNGLGDLVLAGRD